MSDYPSPFRDPANRLVRPVDEFFARAMSAKRAIVRLVGPRRIGKTDLVTAYVRNAGVPFVNVSIPVVPADVQPVDVVLPLLQQAISKLRTSAPALHKAYEKISDAELGTSGKQTIDSEVSGGIAGLFKAKVTAGKERAYERAAAIPAVAAIGPVLGRLEQAAKESKVRPVVLFDEVQELVVGGKPADEMSAVWAIRNEVQHHDACRSVFAGSNQRLYRMLSAGDRAPLLHLGTAVEVPLLTTADLDAWAKPMFEASGRHVDSFATTNQLVAGKIGEAVDVLDHLWLKMKPGEWITEDHQRKAVLAVASGLPLGLDQAGLRTLTRSHTAMLRWVLEHPGESPYVAEALATHRINPGAVQQSLNALVQLDLVENVGDQYVATLPLRTMKALQPVRLSEQLRLGASESLSTKLRLRAPRQGPKPGL